MQSRRHRMRQQQRRESARGWISSGATVAIKTYARRYGAGRYTAYEDLTALAFPLPASAQHRAQRPPPTARPRRKPTADARPLDTDWIMLDGRAFFVAGYTPGGFPNGIFEDEIHDDHDLGEISFLPDCDTFGPEPDGRSETGHTPAPQTRTVMLQVIPTVDQRGRSVSLLGCR
jgi:hypothetical protein